MGSYMHADGIFQKYGPTKAVATIAGDYRDYGLLRECEIDLNLTTLTSTSAIISDVFRFSAGMRIHSVKVITHTAATGSGATLDLGLIKADRTTVPSGGANGIIVALPLTSMDAVGETSIITVGSTGAGSLLGTTPTDVGMYLTARYNTAAYTAGAVKIIVYYYGFSTGTIPY